LLKYVNVSPRIRLVLVQLNGVQDLMCWMTIAFGEHDGDLIAVRNERLALKPHPPIERHGKVLYDDEDARHKPCPLELATKSTSASVPPLTRI
jgi:hypothetical protein